MGLKKLEICTSWSMLIWVIVVLSLQHSVKCQDVGDYNEIDNPAVLPLITQFLYSRMSNLTEVISRDISNRSTFCIKDPDADWNQAFNFSSNLDFLTKCIQKIEGDITRRLCTVAEMKFYSNNFFQPSSIENYLKPNKNCNLTSWVSGCEPGWACSIGLNQPVDLENSREIPARTRSCQACCEGSHGLTCMTPCLLGSHCPLSRLNRTTGVWEPYNYQLPPGQPNHTCGEKTYGLMLAVVVTYSVQQGQDHTVRQQSRKNLAVVDIIAGWDLHLRQEFSLLFSVFNRSCSCKVVFCRIYDN